MGSEYLLSNDCRLLNNQQNLLQNRRPKCTSLIVDTSPIINITNPVNQTGIKKQRQSGSITSSSITFSGDGMTQGSTAAQLILSRKTMRKLKKRRDQSFSKWREMKWTGEKVNKNLVYFNIENFYR